MKRTMLAVFILAGCTPSPVVHDSLIAEVPIPVPCILEKIAPPDWNANHLTEQATSIDELKAALADLDLSKGYIEELEAELKACS